MAKDYLPYLVPLLVAVLIVRRGGRSTTIKPSRMWIRPTVFTLLTAGAIATAPFPPILIIAAYVVAAAAGAAFGGLRALHQTLSIDENGRISSRATAIGTILVLGLFALRFGLKLAFPDLARPGHSDMGVAQAANGLLIFTVSMLFSQSAFLWRRAQPLLAAHAQRTGSD